MESPLEVQASLYGEDGPPMVFTPEASALHLEMRAPSSKPACALTAQDTNDISTKQKRKAPSAREIFAKSMKLRQSYSSHPTTTVPDGSSSSGQKQLTPCQLPGDFPEDLSFRSLAAYSLLRTLSIQLRLSPFTPNAFLRALALPAPNKLLGDVHVALLRILFAQKLKSMGYSYKQGGGGVGVTKKRQVDGIRWPLLAGDNLTHLDGHSWPLFYDDYCHLTADRLWESYHGTLDEGDDGVDPQNFIDFRNIGVFVPPRGEEYKTKMQADDYGQIPSKGDVGAKTKSIDKIKSETTAETKTKKQLPLHIPSSVIQESTIGVADDVAMPSSGIQESAVAEDVVMQNSDKSDSEEEYEVGDEPEDDDDEAWEKPKRKKRRRSPKTSITPNSTPQATLEQKNASSVPSNITSLDSAPGATVSKNPSSQTHQSIQQQLPTQSQIISSVNESQRSMPATSASTSIPKSSIEKPPQEDQPKKSESKPETNISESPEQQQKQNEYVKTENDAPTTDDMTSSVQKPLEEDTPSKSTEPTPETNISESEQQEQQKEDAEIEKEATKKDDMTSSIQKPPQEDAPSKLIEPMPEANVSEQQQQQQKEDDKEAPKKDEVTSNIDPARIRGGGILDDAKFNVPSQSGSGRASMGRPRGSRRALPMRNSNSTPQAASVPMSDAQYLLRQQQIYLAYQNGLKQIDQRFGVTRQIPPSYPFHHPVAHAAIMSNEKMILQQGTPASFEINTEPDMPFKAPDTVANAVNALIRGSSMKEMKAEDILGDVDVDKDNEDSESLNIDPTFEDELEMERWKHFKPLKAMRSGLPYHRLPIEDKICILEFLIDELLTVDAIAAEFTKREIQGSHNTSPFGTLPKEDEYQHMENRDECAVCSQEGDLMCCDGCLCSYHSYCLGMKVGEELPEGKWLCPECSLVDPSNYGSLHGGQKKSLDWFSLDEILDPSSHSQQYNTFGSMISPQFSLSLPGVVSQNVYSMQNPTVRVGTTTAGHLQIKADSQSESTEKSNAWKEKQFIVVHGFVFYRDSTDGNTTFDDLKSSKPCLALTKPEFEAFISQTDDSLLQAWPLAQIPSAVKGPGSWKFPSLKDYFARRESVDPFVYNNKYYGAPLSVLAKVGAANNMVKLMYLTYESQCEKPNTSTLSEVLTQDFSLDAEISACLKTQTGLFDPFQVLKGYMVKLEHTLRRSCMLSEFWDGGQFRSRSDVWVSRVREAQSIRALCRLLLKLVNAMHARAFSAIWFHSHISKSSDAESSSERNYEALPRDWTEEKEKQKRKWEMTPSKMILGLCSDFDNDLLGFASKIRTDIFIPKQGYIRKSKRKLKKAASSLNLKKLKQTDERIEPEKIDQEQVEVNKSENKNCDDPIIVKKGEQKSIANTSNIGNGNVKVDQPRETSCDPAGIKPFEFPGSGIKRAAPTDSDPLLTSKGMLDTTNDQFPVHAESIEAKAIVKNAFPKTPSSDTKEKGEEIIGDSRNQNETSQITTKNQIEPEKMDNTEITASDEMEKSTTAQVGLEKDSKKLAVVPEGKEEKTNSMAASAAPEGNNTEKIEQEEFSKPSAIMREDKEETTNATTVSDPPEGNTDANVESEDVSKPLEISEDKEETTKPASTSDATDENPTSKASESSVKKKRKKKAKAKPREPSTRRRTRHSDRLSSDHLVVNSKVTNASEPKESNEFEALEGMALQLENAKKQKIPGLEKLLKGQYAIEGIWPIAGRRIFPTVGNIPPKEMKRIARNAGSAIAANLSYHTNHEVAQVCYGDIWRKRVHMCNRFEEMLYLLRTLESSLDRSMIHQCENQTRRGKSSLQKVIRCTIRNPSSGSLDHFLVNKKSLKGCWVPGDQLDLSSLILDLFCRRQRQKEQRMERVHAKERMEKEMLQRERQMRIAEATRRAEEERMRKEEARRATKLRKHEDAEKKKLEQEARKKARMMASQQSLHKNLNPDSSALSTEVASLQQKLRLVFNSHEMQVEKALRFFADLNLARIPEREIMKIRKKTMQKIRMINDKLILCYAPLMDGKQIMEMMFDHEKNASMKMQTTKDNVGTVVGNSQNANANTYPQAGNGNFQNRSGSIFSPPNNSPNAPSLFANEHNRQQQPFGNANFSQATIPNQTHLGQNILSPEPIKTPMKSSQNNRPFLPQTPNGYFDGNSQETGFQSSSGRGGTISQSFGQQPQKFAGNIQNQTQTQNSGAQHYSTPNSKKNAFLGPSPGGNDMFLNKQQNSLPNQQINPMSQPHAFSSSMSPMQFAQLQPHQQRHQKQQQMNSRSLSPMQPMPQHPQPHQLNHMKTSNQQVRTQNRQFSQPSFSNAKHNAQPTMSNSAQQQYANPPFNQKDSAMDYRRQQMGMNQQRYASSTTPSPGHLNNSNSSRQAANPSTSNFWNHPKSMANQYNNPSQQNQTSFPGHGGIGQQQQRQLNSLQQRSHQQMQNKNYAPSGMNPSSRPSVNVNSFQGASSMPGQYGSSNPNQTNSGSQPMNNPRQAFNIGYGQPQPNNTMNQNGGNMFPGQQQLQQQGGFARNSNLPYNNSNGPNHQMGGQNRQQPMSLAPSLQRQDFRGQQQQYSQSQSNPQQQQQQPQSQLESIQRQIYMLQQQQKQSQQQQPQQYQMPPNGQFNPGPNGNNFYS